MGSGAQLQEQVNSIWQSFTTKQKTTIVLVILGFVFLVVWLLFARQPKMEVLYAGLSPENASALTSKLKEEKVPYQLVDEGKTILVRAENKYQLRLDMAGEVNLKGVVGFESFNETRFGETDTDKRVRYLVALQGELTRTIEYLDAVEAAKIHIVLPEKSLFIRDEKDATASVLLRLKPYASLQPEQVKSIMSFVSHGVEGLKTENVTVMDVSGRLLSENLAGDISAGFTQVSLSQLTLKQQYEKEVAQSVQSMLEKIVGSGKAVVRASVVLDFDQIETQEERYEAPFLVSEHIREESSSGTTSSPGGNPADENMLAPSYGEQGTGGTNEYELTETTRNYEAGKITERRVVAPGKVTNLSLSVLIDGNLTPDEEGNIKKVVIDAAGINTERGDQVSLVVMPFNVSDTTQMEEELAKRASTQRKIEYVKMLKEPLRILLILGIAYFVWRQLRGVITERKKYVKHNLREMSAIQDNLPEVDFSLSPEAREKKAMQKQVDNLVKNAPGDAAKVVKTWLAEDQR